MTHGIATVSSIPMRSTPSDKSEMISQVLFGEHYSIITSEEKWVYIKLAHDNYQGWIDKKMHTTITQAENDYLNAHKPVYAHTPCSSISTTELVFPVSIASILPFYWEQDQLQSLLSTGYSYLGQTCSADAHNILKTAYHYLNAPYLWGGRSIFGIDCSGFVQSVFRLHGINLPRDSKDQALVGTEINLEQANAADIAFFSSTPGSAISHVGILTDQNHIIHASGRVHICKLDTTGILLENSTEYSHYLLKIQRVYSSPFLTE